jgi:capsular exopolysaccharide synthesis family protein
MLDAVERARQEREKRLPKDDGGGVMDESAKSEARSANAEDRGCLEPSAAGLAPSASSGFSESIVSAHDAQSPLTEQMRQIRTNLEMVLADHSSRTIVVTSPSPADGKTFVAANLATVLADHPDQGVLLIDADMRRPDAHTLLGARASPGLSDVLAGRCAWREAVQPTRLTNFKFMPAGREPSDPTVLLSSERLAAMLEALRREFQWIVCDTPPLLPVTDAAVLARACVGLILVVRLGRTSSPLIERAQELLAQMKLPVLGCILNDLKRPHRAHDLYPGYAPTRTESGRLDIG